MEINPQKNDSTTQCTASYNASETLNAPLRTQVTQIRLPDLLDRNGRPFNLRAVVREMICQDCGRVLVSRNSLPRKLEECCEQIQTLLDITSQHFKDLYQLASTSPRFTLVLCNLSRHCQEVADLLSNIERLASRRQMSVAEPNSRLEPEKWRVLEGERDSSSAEERQSAPYTDHICPGRDN
jgi:hypothetical protein